jgi:hypothetical protein
MKVTVYDFYIGAIMPLDYEKCGIKVTISEQWIGVADLEIENVSKIEKTGDAVCIYFKNTDGHEDWVDIEKDCFNKMEVHLG